MFKRLVKPFPLIPLLNITVELLRIVTSLLSVKKMFHTLSFEVIFLDVSDAVMHSENPVVQSTEGKCFVHFGFLMENKLTVLKEKEEN